MPYKTHLSTETVHVGNGEAQANNLSFEPQLGEVEEHVRLLHHLSHCYESKVVVPDNGDDTWTVKDLWPEKAASTKQMLQEMQRKFVDTGMLLGSERNFAYVPSSGSHVSALAEYILSGLDPRNPILRKCEVTLLDWVKKEIHYPADGGGYLLSGASSAVVAAIAAAREAHNLQPHQYDRAVIYMSRITHICAKKSGKVVGLDKTIFRKIGTDKKYAVCVDEMRQQILIDKKAGLLPFMVIATLGTTDCGSMDPMDDLAQLCTQHGLWFHIDAAYGGPFLLSEKMSHQVHGNIATGRAKLSQCRFNVNDVDSVLIQHRVLREKGVSLSDSITIDPHKGWCQPLSAGILLFRNGKNAGILPPCSTDEVCSPLDRSWLPRAFPIWASFKVMGVDMVRDCTTKNIILANYFYNEIKDMQSVMFIPPAMTVTCFRFMGEEEGDKKTFKLFKDIKDGGRVFLSSTLIDGRLWIRFCTCTMNHTVKSVKLALKTVKHLCGTSILNNTSIGEPDSLNWLENHIKSSQDLDSYVLDNLTRPILDCMHGCHMGRKAGHLNGSVSDVTMSVEEKVSPEQMLDYCKALVVENYDRLSIHNENIRYAGGIGNLLAVVANRFSGLKYHAPGLVALEETMLGWIAEQCSLPATAAGVCTADSRTSDILCVMAAKQAHGTADKKANTFGVYTGDHSAVECGRVLKVMGLSGCDVRQIQSDSHYNITASDLENILTQDKKGGDLTPWLVYNSCDSDLSQMQAISRICRDYSVHHHVHLGAVTSRLLWTNPQKLKDLAEVDSLSVEISAALHLQTAVSAVLVANKLLLRQAIDPGEAAPCLADCMMESFDPLKYSFELTKPSRILPVWAAVRFLGLDYIRDHLT